MRLFENDGKTGIAEGELTQEASKLYILLQYWSLKKKGYFFQKKKTFMVPEGVAEAYCNIPILG